MPPTSLSVVIPNFNHTRFLDEAVMSALGQTCVPAEVIVVDDGSTDGCEAVVARYGSRVRYLRQENQGLAAARNTGIRAATSELVGLLDADDCWHPTFCQEMTGVADAHPAAAACYCRAQTMSEEGRRLPQVLGGPAVPPEELYWRLLRANFIIPSTVVLRRAPVIEVGLFDAALRSCEDWDLWLRLLPGRAMVGHSACLVDYRVHGSSLSGNPHGMQQWARQVIEARFGVEDDTLGSWPPDKRRAFGGLYRYCAISSVQRRLDWAKAGEFLSRGLQVDPTLGEDLDLFYELALAAQPVGYRGVATAAVADHEGPFLQLIESVFAPLAAAHRARGLGTARKALGLAAYNTGHYALSRRYLASAIAADRRLWRDSLVVGDLAKSFVRGWLRGSPARAGDPAA